MKKINLGIKRIFDIFASLIGLIILSPILALIAIAIKCDSKGPVFFLQERIGKVGKTFNIYKFRTMVINAESIGEGLICRDDCDPRITRMGKILRKTSLDELPQLINVLLGEMSIVGPRPPVTYHPYNGYKSYSENAKKRFLMRPGITGLAQVGVHGWCGSCELDDWIFWKKGRKINFPLSPPQGCGGDFFFIY